MVLPKRFDNVKDDDEFDTIGRTCIICCDVMTLYDCKCLPICHHTFHKHKSNANIVNKDIIKQYSRR